MPTLIKYPLFLLSLLSSFPCLAQWEAVPSNTTAGLSEITFISADTGYACGHEGAFLWSFDGGMSWDADEGGTWDYDFIEAINGDTIVLAGPAGIHRTFDGGGTWEHVLQWKPIYDLAYSNAGWLFMKTHFYDTCISSSTTVVRKRYIYYRSSDLGSTNEVNPDLQNSAGQMQFLENGIGFDISGKGYFDWSTWHCEELDLGSVYYTYDGGFTWQGNDWQFLFGPLGPGWFLNHTVGAGSATAQ